MSKRKKKLTVEAVKIIRRDWQNAPRPSSDQLGKQYGVSVSTIDAVVRGKTWRKVA